MQSFFGLCLATGAAVLVVQIALAFLGADGDAGGGDAPAGASGWAEGLDLLSVRSLAAAFAVFGAVGLWLGTLMPGWAAGLLALPAGALGALGTAALMRSLLNLQSDGSLRLEGAVGATAEVYLTVPGGGAGTGLVQLPLQGRSVEMRAVTLEKEAIPTGAAVLVISVDAEKETVEVVPLTSIQGI